MIGVSLKIETPEETYTIPVTARGAINFERQFKTGITKAFADQQKMEHLYWLGWEQTRLSGKVVKPFDTWLDQVIKVQFVFDGDAAPLDSSMTPSSS
jgi:hypothetical protein